MDYTGHLKEGMRGGGGGGGGANSYVVSTGFNLNATSWIPVVLPSKQLAYCCKPQICRHSPGNRCCCSFRSFFLLVSLWVLNITGHQALQGIALHTLMSVFDLMNLNKCMFSNFIFILFSSRKMAMPRPTGIPLLLQRKSTKPKCRPMEALLLRRHQKKKVKR